MNDWRKVLRCRMSGTRAGRGWMVWAIWGMLGTAFTMEGTTGTEGLGGLGMAALLTAPFWLAVCALASFLDMATCSRPSALDGEGGAVGA